MERMEAAERGCASTGIRCLDDGDGVPEGTPGRILGKLLASGGRPVYSMGICETDVSGARRYNIDECDEVYISRSSPRAMSNEDDAVLVRATDGNYVLQPGAISEIPEGTDEPVGDAREFFRNVLGVHYRAEFRGVDGTVEECRGILEGDPPSADAGSDGPPEAVR